MKGKNFGWNSAFYRLYRLLPSGKFVAIYESETCKEVKDGQYEFKAAKIYSSDLVDNNEDQKALIEIFKWSKDGSHQSCGKV